MRYLSLFSGIGGFDLGFDRAGMTCAGQVEYDAAARSVLARHWPNVKRYGDICEFSIKDLYSVRQDVAVGSISSATTRADGTPFVVQEMRQCRGAEPQKDSGKRRKKKGPQSYDPLPDDDKGLGRNAEGAGRQVRDLRLPHDPRLRRSLPSDGSSPGATLSQMQYQATGNRERDIQNGGSCVSCAAELAIDVIAGGFPCQDLSVAGKRAGLSGERSGLFFEIIRIIKELREETNGRYPNFVVLENVPGLLSSHGGRDFALVLSALAESGALDIAWAILDAQWFGVPQRRRRVFIVADFRGQRAAEILSIPYGGGGDIAAGRQPGAELAYTLRANASRSGDKGDGGINTTMVTHALTANGHDASEDGTGRGVPIVAAPLVARQAKGGFTDPVSDNIIAATLNSGGNNGGFRTEPGEHLVMAFQPGNLQRRAGAPPSMSARPTLGAETQGDMAPHVSYQHGVRRLTPVECERLQGFPDGWTAYGADGPQSDSTRYRQLGNAVAVPVAEWLGRRIMEVS